MDAPVSPPARQARANATAARLLEEAGKLFAEKGYDRTTSAEICRRAGTNIAAVNYHFSNLENLYRKVVSEAHFRLMNGKALAEATSGDKSAEERLRDVIALFVKAAPLKGGGGKTFGTWPFRLLSREIVSPSPAFAALREQDILPKSDHLRGLVASLLGRSTDDPLVSRGMFFVVSPCLLLVLMDRATRERVFPHVAESADDFVETLYRFVLAGLRSVVGK